MQISRPPDKVVKRNLQIRQGRNAPFKACIISRARHLYAQSVVGAVYEYPMQRTARCVTHMLCALCLMTGVIFTDVRDAYFQTDPFQAVKEIHPVMVSRKNPGTTKGYYRAPGELGTDANHLLVSLFTRMAMMQVLQDYLRCSMGVG